MTDWQIGDMAVCVSDGPKLGLRLMPTLRKGGVYRVSGIRFARDGMMGLCFDEEPAPHFAFRFKRVVRDASEGCDTEFKSLIGRAKVREGYHGQGNRG